MNAFGGVPPSHPFAPQGCARERPGSGFPLYSSHVASSFLLAMTCCGVPLQSVTRCFVVPPRNSGCDPFRVVVAWGRSSNICDPFRVRPLAADLGSDPGGVTDISIHPTTNAFDPPYGGVAAGVRSASGLSGSIAYAKGNAEDMGVVQGHTLAAWSFRFSLTANPATDFSSKDPLDEAIPAQCLSSSADKIIPA